LLHLAYAVLYKQWSTAYFNTQGSFFYMEKQEKKNPLQKIKEGLDDKEEQLAIISLFVRLGIVVWSGFIVSLNYISLPGYSNEPKDITFPASLLTAAISTFGIEASRKNGGKKENKDDKVAESDGMVQTIRVITPIKIEGAEVIDPKPKK
jgi:hypothetical protein